MKTTSKHHERVSRRWWYPLVVLIVLLPLPAFAQGARLQLDGLNRLSEKSAEVVDVTIDPAMLKFASGFLSNQKSDEAAMKDLISGLTGVYVKSFEFDSDGVYSDSDVEAIRRQLKSPGWRRLVNIDSKRERELVEMYVWQQGDESGGLAILVAEPRELTVVNIVGRIDLNKLGALRGFLGIPRIPGVPPAGQPPTAK